MELGADLAIPHAAFLVWGCLRRDRDHAQRSEKSSWRGSELRDRG